ncbi:GSDMA protein, partial [Chauna torquata]|nr:GSDMA protein [Chauna torquata]
THTSPWSQNSSSRSRMFKKVTQNIAKQMDPKGDLVPVHSIFDQDHFKPLCLVRRKRKALFRPFPCYKRTEYRLHDVLLPGKDNESADSQDSRQFTTAGSVSDRLDGTLSLPIDSAQVELGGTASLSKQWSIKLEKKHIPVWKLEALKTERKINMNHSFIEQLRKMQQNLYVVHETIETSEEASYEESTEAEARLMAQLYAKFSAKGTSESKQSVTIPKGCTLAFRAIQLTIEDAAWGKEIFRHSFWFPGFAHGELGALEKEVKQNCQILSQLSVDLRIPFLKSIKAVMRDRNLFQELTQKVSKVLLTARSCKYKDIHYHTFCPKSHLLCHNYQSKMEAVLDETDPCELTTQSPDLKDLLSSLQFSPRNYLLNLAGSISYILDAFNELTEDQLLLLLESLEEKIVPQQLKLVKSILEHNTQHTEGHFCVGASLLSFSGEKEQKLTTAMIKMSGVKLQENRSAASEQEGFLALAALYASL